MLTFDKVRLAQGAFTLDADFQVQPGKVTAIIGPSGGGKSSLLNAIAGFLEPVTGQVAWDGTRLTGLPPGDRPVAMLFQDNNLFPHMTAAQNVTLGLPDRKADAPVAEVLRQVGLTEHADKKPGSLSGGQQSRVALARVLVSARPLVLLDEPFSALGPALKAEMLTLVQEMLIATGRTVIMVTHDPQDALAIADQVIAVFDGQAAAPIATVDLFADPPAALRDYLGS